MDSSASSFMQTFTVEMTVSTTSHVRLETALCLGVLIFPGFFLQNDRFTAGIIRSRHRFRSSGDISNSEVVLTRFLNGFIGTRL